MTRTKSISIKSTLMKTKILLWAIAVVAVLVLVAAPAPAFAAKGTTARGIVQTTDTTGQSGQFKETNTGALTDFEIIKPDIYVVPGDSVVVVISNPSGRALNIVIVIEINGKEI